MLLRTFYEHTGKPSNLNDFFCFVFNQIFFFFFCKMQLHIFESSLLQDPLKFIILNPLSLKTYLFCCFNPISFIIVSF